ncbi:MAG TPA: hypothetical protein VFT46_03905, partial [Holophagaceae bacterium]|nr:hypothetical protein [Holophagaceae bacterium]
GGFEALSTLFNVASLEMLCVSISGFNINAWLSSGVVDKLLIFVVLPSWLLSTTLYWGLGDPDVVAVKTFLRLSSSDRRFFRLAAYAYMAMSVLVFILFFVALALKNGRMVRM